MTLSRFLLEALIVPMTQVCLFKAAYGLLNVSTIIIGHATIDIAVAAIT